ncbi:hypothetical protein Taro_051947 [Colocasia esculenta]|uniref:Cyanobacterial aminoacyl-tRNA synthetase CAAD domain-containing protein n=1 Tax=Colocasia esculenta TaxID=4460 RepID=A0A843XIS8_COLES|nr:hypothetical protein [Colocasia esculenta]
MFACLVVTARSHSLASSPTKPEPTHGNSATAVAVSPSPPISLRTKMEAFLCASPAITVAHPVRSPLLARQAGASISGPRTSLSLPLASVPSAAASRSRTPGLLLVLSWKDNSHWGFGGSSGNLDMSLLRLPGLSSLSGARGGLLRARATSEDDSSTATFGYLGTAPKAGTETVKETAVEKDDPEAPPSAAEDVPGVEHRSSINFFDQLDLQVPMEDSRMAESGRLGESDLADPDSTSLQESPLLGRTPTFLPIAAAMQPDAAPQPGLCSDRPVGVSQLCPEPLPAPHSPGAGCGGGGEGVGLKLAFTLLDSEDTYYILIYGTGALVALWISSAIVGAIDSLPLFPKMLEIIGLGFTVWFTYRYLLFKKNRDELFEKIDHLKEQILGPSVD